jgi:hypothetical protein
LYNLTIKAPAGQAAPGGFASPRLKPAAFYIPVSFDPDTVPVPMRPFAPYAMNLIHWKRVSWRADRDGFANLKYDYLTRVIPRHLWPTLRKTLVDTGYIECDGHFVPGSRH